MLPAGAGLTVRSFLMVVAVAVLGCASTALAGLGLSEAERRQAAQTLDQRAAAVGQAVRVSLSRYSNALADLAAAVGSQSELHATEFAAIVAPITRSRLPGATGVAMVVPATGAQIPRVQAFWRARGSAGLTLSPAGSGVQHRFVVLGRTLDGSPTRLGRDLTSATEAVEALDRARSSGGIALSRSYVLLRDRALPAAERQAAFVLSAPVYGTEPARDAGAFRGWLVMGLRSADFLAEALGLAAGEAASGAVTMRLSDRPLSAAAPGTAVGPGPFPRPGTAGPSSSGPSSSGPSSSGPASSGPASSGPASSGPASSGPASSGAASGSPASGGPAIGGPASGGPATGAPASGGPAAASPGIARPVTGWVPAREPVGAAIRRVDVEVPGRRWELTVRPTAGLVTGTGSHVDAATWVVGGVITVLLAALVGSLLTSREKALRKVGQATAALREDIERREQVEHQLRQREAELVGFAGVVAHDLRSPLTSIAVHAESLHEEIADRLDEQQLRFLSRIRAGTARMGDLINDLLTYATADRRALRTTTVALGAMAAQIVIDRSSAMPDDQRPHVDIGPLPTVTGDPGLLRQLLDNLIGNAIKYTPFGRPARITLSTRSEPGGWHRIEVADRGIGVPPEQAEAVFVAFSRAGGSEGYPGTGLGLAICARIAERHGGAIGVEPNPGGGSRFWFTLPPTPPGPTPPPQRGGG